VPATSWPGPPQQREIWARSAAPGAVKPAARIRYVHNPSSAARPGQRLMITSPRARYTGERTIAALAPTGHPRSRAAPAGASAGENSLARIWHGYLIFAAFRPLCRGGPDRVFSHPGWSPGVSCCWRQGGFCVRAGCTGGVRHRSLASLGPVRAPGLDLRFLVAGPGFEPGKTVVGDFTDRARYRPDLGERQSNPPLWHAFDMTTRHASCQNKAENCPNPGNRAPPGPVGPPP
jgi:hypothetical protein